jgi:Probable Zinc-ribbon domain
MKNTYKISNFKRMEETIEFIYRVSVIDTVADFISEGYDRTHAIEIYESMTGDNISRDCCKFGGNKRKKLCGNRSCGVCFWRSCASSERAKDWAEENDKRPREVYLSANMEYLLNCPNCLHKIKSFPHNMKRGRCPICSGREVCGKNDCERCRLNSFFISSMAQFFVYEENTKHSNSDRPINLTIRSHKVRWFKCNKCPHYFEMSPNDIARGRWCQYCAHRYHCENNEIGNCEWCYQNSLESYEIAKYWSDSNVKDGIPLRPRDMFPASHDEVSFICPDCKREFSNRLNNITIGGQWCPHCSLKTESKFDDFLRTSNPSLPSFKRGKSFTWMINPDTNYHLKYDFFCGELSIIVEIDGLQHFSQVSNWKSPLETQQRDIIKMDGALQHGISVIRLYQPDVWKWNQEDFNIFKDIYLKNYETPIVECVGRKYEDTVYREYVIKSIVESIIVSLS